MYLSKLEIFGFKSFAHKVAFHFTLSGTQEREFKDNPPTGKRVTISEAYFARLEEGKIVEFRNFQTQMKQE